MSEFTTVAWSQSIATTALYQQINAVIDQSIKTQGKSIYVNEFNKLLGGAAFLGATGLNARFNSPTLRRMAPNQISPVSLALFPTTLHEYDLNLNRMIELDQDEQLENEFYGTAAGAAQKCVLAWLANGDVTPVKGKIVSVMATITAALVVDSWQYSELTLIDDLPVGTYDVVGADVVAASAIAARIVVKGGINRPGFLVRQLVSNTDSNPMFRCGNMGIWTTFPHNQLPAMEILGSVAAASATYNVLLDLIKKS